MFNCEEYVLREFYHAKKDVEKVIDSVYSTADNLNSLISSKDELLKHLIEQLVVSADEGLKMIVDQEISGVKLSKNDLGCLSHYLFMVDDLLKQDYCKSNNLTLMPQAGCLFKRTGKPCKLGGQADYAFLKTLKKPRVHPVNFVVKALSFYKLIEAEVEKLCLDNAKVKELADRNNDLEAYISEVEANSNRVFGRLGELTKKGK